MARQVRMGPPLYRDLRVYAFDPTIGRRFGNHVTLQVPYEELRRGPRGKLVEVIDYDSANGCYYAPVDLDAAAVLAQDGVAPAESNPQFHQQMVYAVAMSTIHSFRSALGREVTWTRRRRDGRRGRGAPLRILPHAMQEANAYYEPKRHALLFGFFAAPRVDAGANLPGQVIFTCLSHDIIAHETTHAVLHEVRRHFMEPTGPDTLAFHEAFADIVALFHHFSSRDALIEHVRRTGGVLFRPTLDPLVRRRGSESKDGSAPPATLAEETQRNVLLGLAQQFGEGVGLRAALRSALGTAPDPADLERRTEPHDRGAILVAAVFDAFFTVYSHRMADLVRMAGASALTGPGEIDADLANRLAREAAKTASQFLQMCIRALDYCPPVDITFGDYLRALITADCDLVPDDDLGYRDILIDAFRRRGIIPDDVRSYSEESLRWEPVERGGRPLVCPGLAFDLFQGTPRNVQAQNARVLSEFGKRHASRLRLDPAAPVQAWSFHPVHRVSPDGDVRFQVVAELLQQEKIALYPGGPKVGNRGGTTLVLDARTGAVLHAIYKRLRGRRRLKRQGEYARLRFEALATAFRGKEPADEVEFARLHRSY
jgi:hypothetical protein